MIHGHGHHIRFEKNEPVSIPAVLVGEAKRWGAELVEGEKMPDVQPEKGVEATDGIQRKADIMGAIEQLVATNSSDDFGGNGRPHVKSVERVLGYNIEAAERDTIWVQYQNEENAED